MSERDWDDLDERLDRAIDALNAERAPDQSEDDDPQFGELVDTARLIRQLREPAEPGDDFPDRLAAAVAARAAGERAATILPNGHVPPARRPADLSRWRTRLLLAQLAAALRVVGVCVLAGMIAGALVGGLGGRVAMRVSGYLFEREFPGIVATTSSSGERVGQLSLHGTLYLVAQVTLFYGLAGGLLYLLVAPWLPRGRRARGLAFAGVLLAIGGAAVITGGNSDFRRFGSPSLNVAMFVALIAGYGLAVAALADWFDRVSRGDAARGIRRAGVVAVRWAATGAGALGALAATLIVVATTIPGLGAFVAREPIRPAAFLSFLALFVALPLARLVVALPDRGVVARLGGPGRVRRFAQIALGVAVAATLVQLLSSVITILSGR